MNLLLFPSGNRGGRSARRSAASAKPRSQKAIENSTSARHTETVNVNETVTKGSPLPMRSTSIGESREIEITLEFEVPWRSPRAVWIGG